MQITSCWIQRLWYQQFIATERTLGRLKRSYMREQPKAQDAIEAKKPEMETMVNPQVTVAEIAWLAGIWDGEGSITVHRNVKISQYSPRISMVNTNPFILQRVCEILDKSGIHYCMRERGLGGFEGSRRQCWIISIDTLAHCSRFINLCESYLVGKIGQAKLQKRFIDSRLKRMSGVKRNSDAPYNQEELDALADLINLNGNQRESSEAIRSSLCRPLTH